MTLVNNSEPRGIAVWRRLGALILALAAVGLPLNDISLYVLLLIVTVIAFCGEVSANWRAWAAAMTIVALAMAGQLLLAPPRIDEGHNVFLPGGALERDLPADVYRHLASEFDRQYPLAKRCNAAAQGCWLQTAPPDRAFAFSADGIFHKSGMSRAVTEINFSDPVWLRLGFINEGRYNWYPSSDVQRARRDGRFWMGLHRWHLTMPWFEMIRLPADYVGGQLCWRGDLLWEGGEQRFSLWRGDGCRAVESADAGRHVVGVAIQPDSLAMRLEPPMPVRLKQIARYVFALAAILALIVILVRFKPRRTVVPFALIGLSALVIAIDDASFLGGVRPLDGGDDGLFYEGVGRDILQKLLAGDLWGFFEGGEKVFYYGGPGLRYFQALAHIVFGDSFLGYLSLVLLLPFLVFSLFKRFLPGAWALALAFLFVAVPLGELFGTTFFDYAKWAARGYADPAAYIFFIAALLPLLGSSSDGPRDHVAPAFFSGLLFALALFMRPLVAPAVAVMLGGAGLAALYQRQWRRLAGLCIGFVPALSMALHNYVFGGVFVLFSANVATAAHTPMPPFAYVEALRELLIGNLGGAHLHQGAVQLMNWLTGPSQLIATIPLHIAGIAILISVLWRGRTFDPWLRLIALAALAQHVPALFYAPSQRYYFLAWFLTCLVCAVWMQKIGMPYLRRRYPAFCRRAASHPIGTRLAFGLTYLQKISA